MTKSARRSSLPASCLQIFFMCFIKRKLYDFSCSIWNLFALWVFQKAQIAFTLRAHAILILSEKLTRANKLQIELEVV